MLGELVVVKYMSLFFTLRENVITKLITAKTGQTRRLCIRMETIVALE